MISSEENEDPCLRVEILSAKGMTPIHPDRVNYLQLHILYGSQMIRSKPEEYMAITGTRILSTTRLPSFLVFSCNIQETALS